MSVIEIDEIDSLNKIYKINNYICYNCYELCSIFCLELYLLEQRFCIVCYCDEHSNEDINYEVIKTFSINDDLDKIKLQIKKIIML